MDVSKADGLDDRESTIVPPAPVIAIAGCRRRGANALRR
jgi:hypothetical protein